MQLNEKVKQEQMDVKALRIVIDELRRHVIDILRANNAKKLNASKECPWLLNLEQMQNEFKKLLKELADLRTEMAHFRALLKGDTASLEALTKLAREHAEFARWQ